MATQNAQTHSARSVRRAKAIDAIGRRPVFRSVLDNPFQVAWPYTPVNIQNLILSHTVQLVNGVAAYHVRREDIHHRKRRALQFHGSNKRVKRQDSARHVGRPDIGPIQDDILESEANQDSTPPILSYITIGINDVTRRLESQAQSSRRSSFVVSTAHPTSVSNSSSKPPSKPPIQLLLVCREDINPPALVAHLPQLIASCNSQAGSLHGGDQTYPMKLVVLPRGSEATLAAALGLRRVAVLALHIGLPGVENIIGHINSLPPLYAPWLAQTQLQHLEPTHIKQLRTTAPKDMKQVKEARVRGRAEAKKLKISQKSGQQMGDE